MKKTKNVTGILAIVVSILAIITTIGMNQYRQSKEKTKIPENVQTVESIEQNDLQSNKEK